jgi:ATP-dependent Clp protease protease subunit
MIKMPPIFNAVTPLAPQARCAGAGGVRLPRRRARQRSRRDLSLRHHRRPTGSATASPPSKFADDLKALGNVKTIDLRINSEGGSVFDGKAMYTQLVEHKAKVITHIDGLAASAASFIAMAGDEIEIAEGGFVMIHNAWLFAMGDARELRRTADLLDTVNGTIIDVYVARTKGDRKAIAR